MKRLLIVFFTIATLQCYSQTFKISEIQTSEKHQYQELASRNLNREVKIVVYDNSLSLNVKGESKPLILQKNTSDKYSFSEQKGENYTSYSLQFKRTFGLVTGIEMNITSGRGLGPTKRFTMIAKRF